MRSKVKCKNKRGRYEWQKTNKHGQTDMCWKIKSYVLMETDSGRLAATAAADDSTDHFTETVVSEQRGDVSEASSQFSPAWLGISPGGLTVLLHAMPVPHTHRHSQMCHIRAVAQAARPLCGRSSRVILISFLTVTWWEEVVLERRWASHPHQSLIFLKSARRLQAHVASQFSPPRNDSWYIPFHKL